MAAHQSSTSRRPIRLTGAWRRAASLSAPVGPIQLLQPVPQLGHGHVLRQQALTLLATRQASPTIFYSQTGLAGTSCVPGIDFFPAASKGSGTTGQATPISQHLGREVFTDIGRFRTLAIKPMSPAYALFKEA